jgi:hypothetical protein
MTGPLLIDFDRSTLNLPFTQARKSGGSTVKPWNLGNPAGSLIPFFYATSGLPVKARPTARRNPRPWAPECLHEIDAFDRITDTHATFLSRGTYIAFLIHFTFAAICFCADNLNVFSLQKITFFR